jgi:transcriptional regulator with XRE-family HTH domain
MPGSELDAGLGQRLTRFRNDKQLTQAAVAREAGVSPAYLSELEGGAGRRPSGRVLLALAEALGVTVADLLGRSIRPATSSSPLPEGLTEFAIDAGLPDGDVQMLAGIRWRGDPPRTKKRWEVIYNAILSSKVFDDH